MQVAKSFYGLFSQCQVSLANGLFKHPCAFFGILQLFNDHFFKCTYFACVSVVVLFEHVSSFCVHFGLIELFPKRYGTVAALYYCCVTSDRG